MSFLCRNQNIFFFFFFFFFSVCELEMLDLTIDEGLVITDSSLINNTAEDTFSIVSGDDDTYPWILLGVGIESREIPTLDQISLSITHIGKVMFSSTGPNGDELKIEHVCVILALKMTFRPEVIKLFFMLNSAVH